MSPSVRLKEIYEKEAKPLLMKEFGYTNPMRLGQGRREIARVLTVTREKELAAYEEQVDAG